MITIFFLNIVLGMPPFPHGCQICHCQFVILSQFVPLSLMPPVPHAVQVGGCHICHRNCQNCQNRTVIFCCHFFPFSHLQHSPWHAPSPSCCPSCRAQSSPSVQGGSSPVTWGWIMSKMCYNQMAWFKRLALMILRAHSSKTLVDLCQWPGVDVHQADNKIFKIIGIMH